MTNSIPVNREEKKEKTKNILLGVLFAFITNTIISSITILTAIMLKLKTEDMFSLFLISLFVIIVVNVGTFIILYRHRRHMSIGWAIWNGVMLLPFAAMGMCFAVLG